MGLTHLAQNKKKNAEIKNETVAFFFFNRFFTRLRYQHTASGGRKRFLHRNATAPFFEEKKSLQIEKQENSDGAKAAPESRRIASRFWRFLRT